MGLEFRLIPKSSSHFYVIMAILVQTFIKGNLGTRRKPLASSFKFTVEEMLRRFCRHGPIPNPQIAAGESWAHAHSGEG